MDISIMDRLDEVMPIFMTRLVDDNGCSITGGAAQVGSAAVTDAMRSDTSWRALSRSVPCLNTSTIEESWGTDFERSSSRPGMPLRDASMGTETSSSTSCAVKPRHAVWISTRGGANSGKTSMDAELSCREPSSITTHASATTIVLNLRLIPMSQRMSVRRIQLCPEQFLGSKGDHRGARCRAAAQLGDLPVDALHADGLADVDQGLGIRVDPRLSLAVIQDGQVRHREFPALRIR